MTSMLFYSLEGLGDSILNVPILARLRDKFEVQVVAFNNGTTAFYRSFHDRVTGINSRKELLLKAFTLSSEHTYICYPVWKKEMAVALLSRAKRRYFLRPPLPILAECLWSSRPVGDENKHQLENNFNLLQSVIGECPFDVDVKTILQLPPASPDRVLAVHPTASTPVKHYPLAFWVQLLNSVAADFNRVQIFCGANPLEGDFCKAIVQGLTPRNAAITQINQGLAFKELATRLLEAEFFIGHDSSLMHLAVILKKPVVALWSFGDYRLSYPYTNGASVYIPRETVGASRFEYPKTPPEFLQRARAADVVTFMRRQRRPDFEITPKYREPVAFYVF